MKKIELYIPVEHKARELKSKIMLVLSAIEQNIRCYIGNKEDIERLIKNKSKKNGIFFFKGGETRSYILNIKNKVDYFVILDEEAGPTDISNYKEQRQRIHKDIEDLVDRYYSIGPENYKVAKKVYREIDVKMTGWPRIDLFRLDKKLDNNCVKLKKKFGKFVLFISDFGETTKKKIAISLKSYKEYLDNSTNHSVAHKKKLLKSFLREKKSTYNEFKKNKTFLKKIDKIKNMPNVIIRPHPYDDHQGWNDFKKQLKNIKIIYEGEISDWIKSSTWVIHRGCSTALKSRLLDIPTAYLTLDKKFNRNNLSFKISNKINSIKQFKTFIKIKKINKKLNYKLIKDTIYIDKKETSSKKIVKDFLKLKPAKSYEYNPKFNTKVKSYYWNVRRNITNFYFESIVKILDFFKLGTNYKKFLVAEIMSNIEKIGCGIKSNEINIILNNLNITNVNFRVKRILSNCYIIDKKND
tara:strand:+ start:32994 stop:34394 length:1401 start_codon:yes stop_codon:yes gene_type:complete